MFFIPFIRDYIELLNNLYDSIVNDINIQTIIQGSFVYLFQTIKFIIVYLFTFQWFRDLCYFPIIIPKISNSILKENFFLEAPLENIFNLLDFPNYSNNKFLIGFLNSFFLSLPLSCSHLIYVRRLMVQGNAAGIAAGLGNIIGQILFIGSVTLGIRFLIIPWFSFESLNYIIGLFLLLNIVYDMVHERVIKIIDWNDRQLLLKIFILNFLLIWTEQSCIFQFLGNLTIGTNPTVLESFSSNSTGNFFFNHLSYLVGLSVGCCFFYFTFAFVLKSLSEYIQIKFSLLRSTWVIRVNFVLLSTILAFSFSSIPYYGLDFLVTGPLGFISSDKAFKNNIFSQNELKDPFGILGGLSDNLSLDTDVTSFDRGFYLKPPILQTFEDLNYSGEYASTIRQGNIPLFDQYKEKARKIREIIIKKDESEKENQQKNNELNKKTTPITRILSDKETSYNSFDYPTFYPIDNNIYISSNIQKRFENNYKQSSNIVFENVLQGTLNNAFVDEKFTVSYPEIEKKIKERFYANPIYKFLLTIDIDTFLKRQPKEFLLSSDQEKELYKKRLMLGRYHDTLRVYNTLPYAKEFQYFFNGSKSFSDRVYNQQFKGTLHIVRRLFSLSYDSSVENKTSLTKDSTDLILKYDQPLYKNLKQEQPVIHEELEKEYLSKSPFLELSSQNPLYFGWDESLRRVVVTNRLLPQSITKFVNVKNNTDNLIEFTTWPLKKEEFVEKTKQGLQKDNSNSKFLFETKTSIEKLNYNNLLPLFEYEDRESGISYYEALPNNITKLASGVVDVVPPNRGGFVWPGNSSLKFSLKTLFQ